MADEYLKYGPWGQNVVSNFGFVVPEEEVIKEIKVFYTLVGEGTKIISGILMKLMNALHREKTRELTFGDCDGTNLSPIDLNAPNEYITTVVGTSNKVSGNSKRITSLRFYTNEREFATVGDEYSSAPRNRLPDKFVTPTEEMEDGKVVGIHGHHRKGEGFLSLGFYYLQPSGAKRLPKQRELLLGPEIKRLGPFNWQAQNEHFNFTIEEGATISSLEFVFTNPKYGALLQAITIRRIYGGKELETTVGKTVPAFRSSVVMKPGEYPTRISWTAYKGHGPSDNFQHHLISSITVETNTNPSGRGPYPCKSTTSEYSGETPDLLGGSIVGVFGSWLRDCIISLGVNIKGPTPLPASPQRITPAPGDGFQQSESGGGSGDKGTQQSGTGEGSGSKGSQQSGTGEGSGGKGSQQLGTGDGSGDKGSQQSGTGDGSGGKGSQQSGTGDGSGGKGSQQSGTGDGSGGKGSQQSGTTGSEPQDNDYFGIVHKTRSTAPSIFVLDSKAATKDPFQPPQDGDKPPSVFVPENSDNHTRHKLKNIGVHVSEGNFDDKNWFMITGTGGGYKASSKYTLIYYGCRVGGDTIEAYGAPVDIPFNKKAEFRCVLGNVFQIVYVMGVGYRFATVFQQRKLQNP